MLKKIQRYRLVSLSCYMQSIYAKIINSEFVSSVIEQKLAQLSVAFERAKMHGCKPIRTCLRVDIRCYLSDFQSLSSVANN